MRWKKGDRYGRERERNGKYKRKWEIYQNEDIRREREREREREKKREREREKGREEEKKTKYIQDKRRKERAKWSLYN